MSELTAASIWVGGILIWLIIRWPHRRQARKSQTVADKRTTRERVMLGLCIVGLVGLPAIHLLTNLLGFANIPYWPIAGWFGTLIMILFLYVFHLSHKHLAANWSVSLEIRKDHQLVDSGIYKNIRHPMYTSFWLWGIAQFLLIPNWVAGLSGLASVALLYFSRIEAEEQMMREQFGLAYEEYCDRTYRLLPKWF